MHPKLREDLLANGGRHATWKECLKFFAVNPGFHVITIYRAYSYLYAGGGLQRLLGRMLWLHVVRKYGCYISPLAKLGPGLELRHPVGVVIGDGVVTEPNVSIYQHVTLGQRGGQGLEQRDYPHLLTGVKVYAGACVLGGITVGENTIIGANAVVLHDIPANAVVVGVPGRPVGAPLRPDNITQLPPAA